MVTIVAQLFLEKLNNHEALMIEISSLDQGDNRDKGVYNLLLLPCDDFIKKEPSMIFTKNFLGTLQLLVS